MTTQENTALNHHIKDAYYGIADNLIGIIDHLKEARAKDPENELIREELKKMLTTRDAFNKSTLGAIL